uniref:Helitron helicase-like domain-containing protein n=1 Tax=Panagrolaimus superbus TaxID=310955 RepID=A0A914Y1D7_9BILA
MSIAQQLGKPTGFGTMTCSTFYDEIKANMFPGQSAWQRIDIVNRIFKLKVDFLIEEIKDKCIFGKLIYLYYVVEFQKRGLAHIHWVMNLENKWDTPEKVDRNICAELPIELNNDVKDPILLDHVLKFMIHAPCGDYNPNAPCMKDGKCIRGFPKPWCNDTKMDEKGFTVYKRRNNGVKATIKYQGKNYEIDNRWVVPYNPYMLKKMKCHINLECEMIKL